MPAYNFAAHEELSSYLEKHPSLFGFYSDGLYPANWIKDTGMISQPYRHANAYFPARPYETPPSSPSTAQTLSTSPELQTFYFSDSDHETDHSEQHPSRRPERVDRSWLYQKYSHSSAKTHRNNAEDVSKVHVNGTGLPVTSLMKSKKFSSHDGYDFSQLDGLLVNLASLLQSCLVHVSSPSRPLRNTSNPLPERLIHPLESFYEHIDLEDSVILPRKGSIHQRWCTPPYSYEIRRHATVARAPRFDERQLPSPLGSHPPAWEQNLTARRLRAVKILRQIAGGKRYLLPSLMALIIARFLVLALLAVLFRRRSERLPAFPSYYTPSKAIRSYSVPSKASELLGLSYIGLIARSTSASSWAIHEKGQKAGVRASDQFSWSPDLSIKEIDHLKKPVSRWSPWSRSSSSCFSGVSRKSYSFELPKGPSSRSSYIAAGYNVDEFESRIDKLHELEKTVEKLLRTGGWWIWGRDVCSKAGDTESRFSVVDAQVENSYELLVREGLFRRV